VLRVRRGLLPLLLLLPAATWLFLLLLLRLAAAAAAVIDYLPWAAFKQVGPLT
jgi:hypothetical protein